MIFQHDGHNIAGIQADGAEQLCALIGAVVELTAMM
jgi:hypothetical protein